MLLGERRKYVGQGSRVIEKEKKINVITVVTWCYGELELAFYYNVSMQ